ncbi:Uncharacterised protein g9908 [Pycnogonum litorale]
MNLFKPGGYVFVDPSKMVSYKTMNKSRMAWLSTAEFPKTDAIGKCLKFSYNVKGLSSKALNVLLKDFETEQTYKLWSQLDDTLGEWKMGRVSFTSENRYKLIFEAIPNPKNPSNRGFIAVDNIEVTDSACLGDCLFDADYCTWTNVKDADDFDFILGRGSANTITGPTCDHTSLARKGNAGGYIYIDSNFPRKPGDTAQLLSAEFNATLEDEPMCMTFWFSAYGPGIGSLTVSLIDSISKKRIDPIWKLTSGMFDSSANVWYEARTTIAHQRPYQVLIEAIVGESDTGDIAMDDLRFDAGPCPVLPQIASVGNGDCAFFLGGPCEWTVSPIVQEVNSRPMWSLVHGSDTLLQPEGHTSMTVSDRHEGYMRFWTANYMHYPLDASALIGPKINTVNRDTCIAFWVYMYSSSISDLGIGSLNVILVEDDARNTTLWNLSGSQSTRWFYGQTSFRARTKEARIAFVGIKGLDILGNIAIDDVMIYPGKCTTSPQRASTHPADCSFDLNPCLWTVSDVESGSDPKWKWLKPRKLDGPKLVRDHTFNVAKDGFMYVEILNAPVKIETELVSPEFAAHQTVCLSFYFTSYGFEDGASLQVLTRRGTSVKEWWNVTRKANDEASKSTKPQWRFGQVTLTSTEAFKVKVLNPFSHRERWQDT